MRVNRNRPILVDHSIDHSIQSGPRRTNSLPEAPPKRNEKWRCGAESVPRRHNLSRFGHVARHSAVICSAPWARGPPWPWRRSPRRSRWRSGIPGGRASADAPVPQRRLGVHLPGGTRPVSVRASAWQLTVPSCVQSQSIPSERDAPTELRSTSGWKGAAGWQSRRCLPRARALRGALE